MAKKIILGIAGFVLGFFLVFFILNIGGNGVFNSLFGSSFENAKDKTFSKAGMSIVLTEKFTEKEQAAYTSAYDSERVAVFTLKEEFTLQEGLGDLSLNQYAQLVIEANKLDAETKKEGDLTYFQYTKQANGKDNNYYAYVYKSADAFWLIQFACESKYNETTTELFIKWAKSVKV